MARLLLLLLLGSGLAMVSFLYRTRWKRPPITKPRPEGRSVWLLLPLMIIYFAFEILRLEESLLLQACFVYLVASLGSRLAFWWQGRGNEKQVR